MEEDKVMGFASNKKRKIKELLRVGDKVKEACSCILVMPPLVYYGWDKVVESGVVGDKTREVDRSRIMKDFWGFFLSLS